MSRHSFIARRHHHQSEDGAAIASVSPPLLTLDGCQRQRPEAIQTETLRRMEGLVLETLAAILVDTRSEKKENTLPQRATNGRSGASLCATSVSSAQLRELRQLFVCLPILYVNVQSNVTITQRDLYYHLVRCVPDQRASDRCVKALTTRLGVPRRALNVVAGQRGSVGGAITFTGGIYATPHEREEDLSAEITVTSRDGGRKSVVDIPIPADETLLRVAPFGATPTSISSPPLSSLHTALLTSERWSSGTKSLTSSSREGVRSPNPKHALLPLRYSPPLFYLHSNTRAVIVVEKYTVYHRLMQEGCMELFPCVLLTSHGFPTQAARRLLACIALSIREAFDESYSDAAETERFLECRPSVCSPRGGVPSSCTLYQTDGSSCAKHRCPDSTHGFGCAVRPVLLALGDYNPSGVSIILQYKFGSRAQAEGDKAHCRVPELRWLGLRSAHIFVTGSGSNPTDATLSCGEPLLTTSGVPVSSPPRQRYFCQCPFTSFTPRDDALVRHLIEELQALQATYCTMLRAFHRSSVRGRGLGSRAVKRSRAEPKEEEVGEHSFNDEEITVRSDSGTKGPSEEGAKPKTDRSLHSPAHHRRQPQRYRRRTFPECHYLVEELVALPYYHPLTSQSALQQWLQCSQHDEYTTGGERNRIPSRSRCTACTPPALLETWVQELRIMQEARMKVEVEGMIDLEAFSSSFDAASLASRSDSAVERRAEEEETRGRTRSPACGDTVQCYSPQSHACREAAPGAVAEPSHASRPLSNWLYQCLLQHDYV